MLYPKLSNIKRNNIILIASIAISIIVLLLTIVIVASVSIKIYSNAILNYGSRVSLKDMINMYKHGN